MEELPLERSSTAGQLTDCAVARSIERERSGTIADAVDGAWSVLLRDEQRT